jgi:hypothetical protein
MADTAVDRPAQERVPLLVFVHIPKTAGTTLTTILSMNEPGPGTRHGGNVFKGGGGIKQGVKFESLLKNAKGELDRARILTGHFPFAIREYLPKDRDVRYLTILREPADRTLSHYFAIRDRHGGAEGPKRLGLSPLPAEASLEDALAGGYLHDNVQTRMLSGVPEPFGEVTDEMLERAKHNVREEFLCVGLTERFDESLVLARQRLGLRVVLSAGNRSARSRSRSSGRVNSSRPRGDEIPAELRRAAEHCNRYDIELYRYAQELFDGAPERRDVEFEIELAALRAAKAGGATELEAPRPSGFDGDERAWRMLLQARATCLRHELELAELKTLACELSQRDRELLELLGDIHAGGKTSAGRDAQTAMRVLQVLAPAQAKALADGAPTPDAASSRQRAGTKRRRSATRALAVHAPDDGAARKRRNRTARKSSGG